MPPSNLARVFVLRVIWGVCLAVGAAMSGVGMEAYASGAGRAASACVVVAGVLLVPLSSAVVGRFLEAAPTSE